MNIDYIYKHEIKFRLLHFRWETGYYIAYDWFWDEPLFWFNKKEIK